MRWIVLALSLGTFIMSLLHSVFMLFGFFPVSSGVLPSWLVGVMTILSALLALIGGIVAFGRNRMGSVFLMLAALLCIVAPSEFWIYGSLYLIATVFCFFLPRRADFMDAYDDEEDEDDDEAEEKLPIDPRELSQRRREQLARIPSVPQEKERRIPIPNPAEEGPKIRKRTSKTCPACGANVAISDRYCSTCGSSLHIPSDLQKEEPVAPEPPVQAPEAAVLLQEPAAASEPFRKPSLLASEPDAVDDAPPQFPSEKQEPEGNPLPFPDAVQVTAPHKVFVKPLREGTVPKRPLNIDPDASYQEFSQYARRRKRRPRSLGLRILGVLILLGVVGGTTWFLLGLRKLPENKLPVRPAEDIVITPPVSESPDVVVAQPIGSPKGALPPLTLRETPEQGRVTGSNVNLREDHSTTSKSIVRLQTNARGHILNTWEGTSGSLNGIWYRIRTGDNREGWIFGQYFQPLGEALPAGYTDALLKSFGADRAEALAELGQPSQSKGGSLSWRGLTVTLSGETITRLQLSASGRELKNGVKVGMTRKELVGLVGYPSQLASGQWRYTESDGRGMGVQFNKDGAVSGVTVGKL